MDERLSPHHQASISEAWKAVHAAADTASQATISGLFAEDAYRFRRFSASLDGLLLDASKTSLTVEAWAALLALARASGVEARRDAMFAGEPINLTEKRAVLHTALRNRSERAIHVDGKEVMPAVRETLGRLQTFATGVRSGQIAAADGQPFTDVVNIGIGGSDLGPAMVTQALRPFHDGPRVHFVSNIDGSHLADTLAGLDAARTLFIVASKTFTTIETMTNARSARAWLAAKCGESAIGDHFCAVSTALDKVAAFGIRADRVFGFWDWVGGRYSVWSAVGLPVMIAIGPERFDAFLGGAHSMDEHFRTAPLEHNLPVWLGLVGVWHRNGLGYASRAVLPYDQRLARLPAYLQQLDMESNGKRVTLDGAMPAESTGPVVWGEPGSNGQHAFMQLIHQGMDVIPVEVLVAARGHEPELAHHHTILLANALAQTQALMRGRSLGEARAILEGRGFSAVEIERLAPHMVFPGSRPSVTILYPTLDPRMLGMILALYEHRVFVEAAIWGINAFDQWGVELGKELATRLQPVVEGKADAAAEDGSTAGLIGWLRRLNA